MIEPQTSALLDGVATAKIAKGNSIGRSYQIRSIELAPFVMYEIARGRGGILVHTHTLASGFAMTMHRAM